jgi:hypothetical protein
VPLTINVTFSLLCTFFNTLAVIAIMDFAPYQDTSPETARTLSPPPTDRRSSSFSPRVRSPAPLSPPLQGPPRGANPWAPISGSSAQGFGNGNNPEAGRGRLVEFETSLPIRLDYEACLAYLLLPPAGGVLLLVLEHKSDYVRYVMPFPYPFHLLTCATDRITLKKPELTRQRIAGSMHGNLHYCSRPFSFCT